MKLVTGLDNDIIMWVDHWGQPHPLDGDDLVTSGASEVGADLEPVPDKESKHHEHAAAGDHGQHDNCQCPDVDLDKVINITFRYW